MAKIYCKKTPSSPSRLLLIPLAGGFCAAGVIGLILQVLWLAVAGFLGFFLCLLVGRARNDPARTAGAMGEHTLAQVIAQLPEDYYGFQNLHITYDGQTSEMDMVVVGPTGVYIIETKNLNGTVVGHFDQPQWILHKTGRRGGEYEKTFYSPVKQVGTHVYRLAHYLRKNGCQVHVDAMVFFANAHSVQVHGQPKNIPLYAGRQGAALIHRQILSGTAALSAQTIHRICQLLYPCL